MTSFFNLPNWHPLVVHFPVALFTSAVLSDAALLLRFRRGWLDRAIVLMYALSALGSLAAALSGKLAADAMTDALAPEVKDAVAAHGDWAFFTVIALWVTTAVRFDVLWRDRSAPAPSLDSRRLAAFVIGCAALGVVAVTASHGGDLVYRHGVGVDHGIIPTRR